MMSSEQTRRQPSGREDLQQDLDLLPLLDERDRSSCRRPRVTRGARLGSARGMGLPYLAITQTGQTRTRVHSHPPPGDLVGLRTR